jgi:hypothetical protein
MSSTDDRPIPIHVGPPVYRKFRTGSYLIYDDEPLDVTHFRKGTELKDMPFRASGSRQLDVSRLADALKSVAQSVSQLYLVDLREETHLFFNSRAVSWYADKDFANVGQTLEWIVADEAAQLARITALPATQLFSIKEDDQGNVTPTGYSELVVESAATEEDVAAQMPSSYRPDYIRIPVTDHCMPNREALNRFIKLCVSLKPGDWVHCHCHGGDGRTTTFLALFDMVHWAKSKGTSGFQTVEEFAQRQCQIFPYCLKPDGCPETWNCKDAAGDAITKVPPTADWKYYLALQRWWFLDLVRTWIVNGGLGAGQPFSLPDDWEQRIASAS